MLMNAKRFLIRSEGKKFICRFFLKNSYTTVNNFSGLLVEPESRKNLSRTLSTNESTLSSDLNNILSVTECCFKPFSCKIELKKIRSTSRA